MNIKNGQRVSLHYTGKFKDGSVFDSSKERNSPLHFIVGSGVVLENFENAIKSMQVGEKKTFDLTSDQAYGPHVEDGIQDLPKDSFGEDMKFEAGAHITGTAPDGRPVRAVIVSENDDTVTVDFNHPLAGKDITFDVEILGVE